MQKTSLSCLFETCSTGREKGFNLVSCFECGLIWSAEDTVIEKYARQEYSSREANEGHLSTSKCLVKWSFIYSYLDQCQASLDWNHHNIQGRCPLLTAQGSIKAALTPCICDDRVCVGHYQIHVSWIVHRIWKPERSKRRHDSYFCCTEGLLTNFHRYTQATTSTEPAVASIDERRSWRFWVGLLFNNANYPNSLFFIILSFCLAFFCFFELVSNIAAALPLLPSFLPNFPLSRFREVLPGFEATFNSGAIPQRTEAWRLCSDCMMSASASSVWPPKLLSVLLLHAVVALRARVTGSLTFCVVAAFSRAPWIAAILRTSLSAPVKEASRCCLISLLNFDLAECPIFGWFLEAAFMTCRFQEKRASKPRVFSSGNSITATELCPRLDIAPWFL